MRKINKKAIIIIIIVLIIITSIIYEKFIKNKNNIEKADLNIENITEIEDKRIENKTEEKEEKILVYVAGMVNKEGVYELSEGKRIKDAIDLAGGLQNDAEIDEINLAEILEDGMKIYIPNKKESLKSQNESSKGNELSKQSVSTKVNKNTQNINQQNSKTTKNSQKININTATQTELETLPGVGPSTALKIITYRKEKGSFKTIEDIKNVKGIGDSKYNKLKNFIKV